VTRPAPDERTRLARRREALLALSAAQRGLVAARWQALTTAPPWLRLAQGAWRLARAHPWASAAPLAALALLRPRWAWRAATAAAALLRIERWLR
jgi:hypothetical protein